MSFDESFESLVICIDHFRIHLEYNVSSNFNLRLLGRFVVSTHFAELFLALMRSKNVNLHFSIN
jgi:hypothetical protein